MIVKVKYFDIEKYEAEWQKYYKDEETIHTNRLMSPTDKGFSPYLKEVEIETEIFIKQDLTNKQPSVFNQIVEIDNDYLYHDNVGYYYISHIHTLRVLNEYYTKYKNLSNLVDLTNGLFAQIERELKLKTIIND
jgi:hypothetical protein